MSDQNYLVLIWAGDTALAGELQLPPTKRSIVILPTIGRLDSKIAAANLSLAGQLSEVGLASLQVQLLTDDEEQVDSQTARSCDDPVFLADRLVSVTRWVQRMTETREANIGYLAWGDVGAAALTAAADIGPAISAVVALGGRSAIAGNSLARLAAPMLMIVGSEDSSFFGASTLDVIRCDWQLLTVANVGQVYEKPEALETASLHAVAWLSSHLIEAGLWPHLGRDAAEQRDAEEVLATVDWEN